MTTSNEPSANGKSECRCPVYSRDRAVVRNYVEYGKVVTLMVYEVAQVAGIATDIEECASVEGCPGDWALISLCSISVRCWAMRNLPYWSKGIVSRRPSRGARLVSRSLGR